MIRILARTIDKKVEDPIQEEEDWINRGETALNAEFMYAEKIVHNWKSIVYKYYFRTKE